MEETKWKNHAEINPGRLLFAKLKNIHVIFEAFFDDLNTSIRKTKSV